MALSFDFIEIGLQFKFDASLRNKIAEVEGEKKKLRDRKNRFAAKLDES